METCLRSTPHATVSGCDPDPPHYLRAQPQSAPLERDLSALVPVGDARGVSSHASAILVWVEMGTVLSPQSPLGNRCPLRRPRARPTSPGVLSLQDGKVGPDTERPPGAHAGNDAAYMRVCCWGPCWLFFNTSVCDPFTLLILHTSAWPPSGNVGVHGGPRCSATSPPPHSNLLQHRESKARRPGNKRAAEGEPTHATLQGEGGSRQQVCHLLAAADSLHV